MPFNYRKYSIDHAHDGSEYSCAELGLHSYKSDGSICRAIDRETFVADLADALAGAEMAAEVADPGTGLAHDGGSVNFDTPVLTSRCHMGQSTVDKVVALCGIEIEKGYRPGQWLITGIQLKGQGFRRTKMAQAAAGFLTYLGFDAGVHYAVD